MVVGVGGRARGDVRGVPSLRVRVGLMRSCILAVAWGWGRLVELCCCAVGSVPGV
jgi:hypothetical protein